MAGNYLKSKWEIWYKSLDVNHDGKISIEDVEESRSKFSQLHQLDDKLSTKTKTSFADWWNVYIFRNKVGDVSMDQFTSALENDLKADPKKFQATMEKCFDEFFDVIDTNKDRSISEEEFLIAFQAMGHENVALDTKFFQAYEPKEGLVPLKDIVKSWVDFATSQDESKKDVVKNAFESGV